MKTRIHQRLLAIGLSLWLAFPGATVLSAQAQTQRAGQVAAQIPAGQIERAVGVQPAEVGTVVLWDDLVTTAARGRVRVTLDDGSLLNLGSNSSLRVIRHDAITQQSELVLTLGQMRVRTRLLRPGASFTVRTNTAVLGVIGTDFWVFAGPTETQVIVYEGMVTVSNIAGVGASVSVGAGNHTAVFVDRPPNPPSPPSQINFQNSLHETQVGEPLPEPPGPRVPSGAGAGKLPIIVTVGVVAAMAVAVGLMSAADRNRLPPPTSQPRQPGRTAPGQ